VWLVISRDLLVKAVQILGMIPVIFALRKELLRQEG